MEKALESDWKYYQAAVDDLEDFILAPQDSWPLSGAARRAGPRDTGRLTIGNLLLARARLAALAEDSSHHEALKTANDQIQQVRERWRANWARKAEKEFQNRLNLWNTYVNELLDDNARHISGYPDAVRWRVILELLLDEADRIDPGARAALNGLDRRLRVAGKDGPFVWEPEVEPAFPKEQFWYLYLSF
jgi:uncharacterized protein YukE